MEIVIKDKSFIFIFCHGAMNIVVRTSTFNSRTLAQWMSLPLTWFQLLAYENENEYKTISHTCVFPILLKSLPTLQVTFKIWNLPHSQTHRITLYFIHWSLNSSTITEIDSIEIWQNCWQFIRLKRRNIAPHTHIHTQMSPPLTWKIRLSQVHNLHKSLAIVVYSEKKRHPLCFQECDR